MAMSNEALARFQEAEALYRRAIAIREKAFSREHILVAQSLEGLAGVYRKMGRYAEAEPLLQRVLAIRERVASDEDPGTAQTSIQMEKDYLILKPGGTGGDAHVPNRTRARGG
jgi:tetratricopeptide (TPR) repeat protein